MITTRINQAPTRIRPTTQEHNNDIRLVRRNKSKLDSSHIIEKRLPIFIVDDARGTIEHSALYHSISTHEVKHTAVDSTTVLENPLPISDSSTFGDLLKLLKGSSFAAERAKHECIADKEYKALRDAQLGASSGKAHDPVMDEDEEEKILTKVKGRVTAKYLRENVKPIARFGDDIIAYENGYAEYRNGGSRSLVIWIPDCDNLYYKFADSKPSERKIVPDHDAISSDQLIDMTWYIPIELHGMNKREYNLFRDKGSSQNATPFNGTYAEEEALFDDMQLHYLSHPSFPNPEKALLNKELWEIVRNSLTKMQWQVVYLFLIERWEHKDIAEELGITYYTEQEHWKRAKKKLREVLAEYYGR